MSNETITITTPLPTIHPLLHQEGTVALLRIPLGSGVLRAGQVLRGQLIGVGVGVGAPGLVALYDDNGEFVQAYRPAVVNWYGQRPFTIAELDKIFAGRTLLPLKGEVVVPMPPDQHSLYVAGVTR